MEFLVLGPLEVRADGQLLTLGGPKQRALLALLLLNANEVVSTDRLADELWGERLPPTAVQTLRVYVSQLRKLFAPFGIADGSPALRTHAAGYVLELAPDEIDSRRFERQVSEARRLDAERKGMLLREALSLWRGDALVDFAYEPFAQTEIARLEELRLIALEERLDADLASGRSRELTAELETLVSRFPLRERFRAQLMLALVRSGRQADALECYRDGRLFLRDELGIEPSPALRALEGAILRQDATLALPASDVQAPVLMPTEAPPLQELRKPVTALFCDLVDSTGLGERLDSELLRLVLQRYYETAAGVLERHGGTVEKFIGDAVMAVFGVPTVHEDDALRAVRAAVELLAAIAALNEELVRRHRVSLEIRIGLNSGEVIAAAKDDGRALATGDVVNTAARLQQITPPGTIAMGETTRRLVANAVRLEPLDAASLKGKRKPVTAWRLVEVLPGAPPFARRLDAPMVGRAAELAQLEAAFERVCSDRSPYLFTVLGAAGIGKTRLAGELLASLAGRATALVGRCLPYGRDITYWPLREVIGSAVEHDGREAIAELLQGEDDADVVSARVATAIGLGTGEAVAAEETAWALRRLFETLARRRPLLIVFEDVHWAESAFLDLVEYLADWLRDAPVYIVCLARPELFEARPNWLGGKLNAGSLLLEPLPADAVELLIDELPAGAALTPATRSKVKSTAEGNPLFVEQLLASWSEDPRPRAELEVPETVQALLAARLDRLGPAERHVVERAAVIGRDFWLAGVEALLPEDGRDTAARHLHSLTRKDLVRPERSELSGLEGFRFRHILIQQAAYRATPKRRRAELHERFADWFTEYLGERAPEHQEILGYHLEQAFRYSSELGPIDERVRAIGVAAADRLAAAGHRADARCDTRAAAALFDRACALLEGDDPRRLRLLPDLGNALRMYGDLARAENTLNEAVAGAEASGDRALYARAAVERALVQLEHEPTSAPREVVGRVAREAIPILESSSDYRALAKAWNLRSFEFGLELGYETSMEMRERALDYARRARDARVEAEMLLWIGLALWEGPMPVDDALARADELFAAASGPLAAAVGLVTFACLKALRGDFDEARELRPRATAILQDLGLDLWIAGWANAWGPIELLAGEPEAAEELLRSGYEELERLGEKSYRSTMAGSLAEALYQQGRYEEAARFAIVCAELAGKDDLGSQIPWRMTKAKLLAREANGGAAEELGREAVALAQKTDALRMQGDTFTAFAEVLDLTGRRREAEEYARKALERYQRKGIIPAIARTRAFLDRAEPARSRR